MSAGCARPGQPRCSASAVRQPDGQLCGLCGGEAQLQRVLWATACADDGFVGPLGRCVAKCQGEIPLLRPTTRAGRQGPGLFTQLAAAPTAHPHACVRMPLCTAALRSTRAPAARCCQRHQAACGRHAPCWARPLLPSLLINASNHMPTNHARARADPARARVPRALHPGLQPGPYRALPPGLCVITRRGAASLCRPGPLGDRARTGGRGVLAEALSSVHRLARACTNCGSLRLLAGTCMHETSSGRQVARCPRMAPAPAPGRIDNSQNPALLHSQLLEVTRPTAAPRWVRARPSPGARAPEHHALWRPCPTLHRRHLPTTCRPTNALPPQPLAPLSTTTTPTLPTPAARPTYCPQAFPAPRRRRPSGSLYAR